MLGSFSFFGIARPDIDHDIVPLPIYGGEIGSDLAARKREGGPVIGRGAEFAFCEQPRIG
jgi:hypothetical protein